MRSGMSDWRKKVPKAPLIRFEWWPRWRRISMFRLANVRQIHLGPLMIMVRAPWLEHAARAHYPELFKGA